MSEKIPNSQSPIDKKDPYGEYGPTPASQDPDSLSEYGPTIALSDERNAEPTVRTGETVEGIAVEGTRADVGNESTPRPHIESGVSYSEKAKQRDAEEVAEVQERLRASAEGLREEGAIGEHKVEKDSPRTLGEILELSNDLGVHHKEDLASALSRAPNTEKMMDIIDDARSKEGMVYAARKTNRSGAVLVGGGAIMTAGLFAGSAAVLTGGVGIALLGAPATYLFLRNRYKRKEEKHSIAAYNLRKKLGLSK